MAHISYSPSSSSSCNYEKLDIEFIRAVVISINQYIFEFLINTESRNSLKLKCTAKLKYQNQEYFEFSEHSVISNLYWGIESIESAINSKCPEEKTDQLKSCEQMLQVPALLDEHGSTAGIANRYLVCYAYFYLSVVRKLQRDELQVALHFLQALLVSPRLVMTEVAPKLCETLFPLSHVSFEKLDKDEEDEGIRLMVRRCKDRLMYYRVMLYGDNPQWHRECSDFSILKDESQHFTYLKSTSIGSSSITSDHGNGSRTNQKFRKVHPLDPVQNTIISIEDKVKSTIEIQNSQEYMKALKELNQICNEETKWNSNVKCLQDMLKEPQSDTPITVDSHDNFSTIDYDSKESETYTEDSISITRTNTGDACSLPEKDSNNELIGIIENAISNLSFSGPTKCDQDYSIELSTTYKTLKNKFGANYTLLKNVILDILLTGISASKEEGIIRISVSILTTLVLENKSSIEDIKKKGLRLCDLANALKRNVDDAAILIYLVNPSPEEIMKLEILPALIEIVCTSKNQKGNKIDSATSPHVASLMIIQVLVSSYDYDKNNMHLDIISTPRVISSLMDVAKSISREEFFAFASIVVKCIRFDGECRKYVAQHIHLAPILCLLKSNKKSVALELFHEILHIPRSSAIGLLKQIKREGNINITHLIIPCLKQLESEHRLLAAELLLQLDILEDSPEKNLYREEAVKMILKSVASEECPARQQLASFILSNMGGTYTWTGEPYTVAWLVKKAGLSSLHHKNMIKSFNWLDHSLQDTGIDTWSSKIAKTLIKIGKPVFHALEKGLNSKTPSVSRDCLTTIAWLGYEIAKSPNSIRNSACDIVLKGTDKFLHPGSELEERLLACLCIYNYTSGKGMQRIMQFSEGTRESLRRLSYITWMAEELLKVADYFLPNKMRISCVHTQILEAGHSSSGSVTALIYYKGQLYSGYSDGSIKVWDIKGQTATLVLDMKEHKKAVTCFSLFEPMDGLLSGSADKTIKLWKIVQKKLECTEVIAMKESIRSVDTYGQLVFVITQNHSLKMIDASRTAKDIYKSKNVKCIRVVEGKIYIGCMDSSIQKLNIINNRGREIKEPVKSWIRIQNRPINSLAIFRNWVYSASAAVEGSLIKDWRMHNKPQISLATGKGSNLLAMGVVEDFIYLNCSSSVNVLQIWLRGSQQKVGRLSAGSRITSLLTANDMVICGTESGLIKGWIPL